MVMKNIPNLNNLAGKFKDEVDGVSDGTQLEALHLNTNTINELVAVVEAAGLVCDNTGVNQTQLLTAINTLINNGGRKFKGNALLVSEVNITGVGDFDIESFSVTDSEDIAGTFDYFIEMELKINYIFSSGISVPSVRIKAQSGTDLQYSERMTLGGLVSTATFLTGVVKMTLAKDLSEDYTFSFIGNKNGADLLNFPPNSKFRVYRRPTES